MLLFLTIGAGDSVEIDRDDLRAAIRLLASNPSPSAQQFGRDLLLAWKLGVTESLEAAEAVGYPEEIQHQLGERATVNALMMQLDLDQ
jgi:hypothetical protein